MAGVVATVAKLKPELRLAEAISQFEASLSNDEKIIFRDQRSQSLRAPPGVNDVMRLTAQMDRSQKPGRRCFGPRFTKFLHGIQQYAALGDIIVGGAQNIIAAGVWTVVRTALVATVKYSTYLESLSLLLMEASRSLPQRYDLAILFPKSESLQSHLTEYHIVVVQICHRFRSYVQSSTLRKITSSLNDADIKEFQSKLVSWSKSIGEEIIFLMASRTEEEAQQNSRFRDLMIKASKTATRQQKLSAFQRVLSLCSTFDHETCWKQIRKSGNTSTYAQIAEYGIWKRSSRLPSLRRNCLILCAQIGFGKSVMLANIVDDLVIYCESEQASVAYFFCKHDIPESLKARTILGALTRQIIGQFFNNFDFGMVPDEPTIGYDVMINLIKQIVPTGHILFFILDGLDLCDRKEQERVVNQLHDMSCNVVIRPCISLRLGPDARSEVISAAFPQATIVSQVDNTGDIEAYINEELARCVHSHELIVGDPLLILKICEALSSGSRGMFLWVVLMIKELCLLKTDEEISNALSNLPKDLSEIYKKILQRSSLRSTKHKSRIFQLITAAQRPLTTEELREALSVQPGDTDWTATKLINDINMLLAGCGCLLVVEEEEHCIRFVHPSVQQFFLDHYEDAEDSIITLETCHRMMADVLVTYLSYTVFGTELSTFCVPKIDIGSAPTKVIESTMESSKSAQALALKLLKFRKQPEFDISGVIAKEIQSHKDQQRQIYHLVEYARENYLEHISETPNMGPHVTKLFPKLLERAESPGNNLPRAVEAYQKAMDHENIAMMEIAYGVNKECVRSGFSMPGPSGNLFIYSALGLAICHNREKIVEQREEIFSKDSGPLSSLLDAPCEIAFSGTKYHVEQMMKEKRRSNMSGYYGKSHTRHICFSGRNLLACAVWGGNKEVLEYLVSTGEYDPFGVPFDRSAAWEAVRQGASFPLALFFASDFDRIDPSGDAGPNMTKIERLRSLATELGHRNIIQLLNGYHPTGWVKEGDSVAHHQTLGPITRSGNTKFLITQMRL